MSNVTFVEDQKSAYVSCPMKCVVDLSKTKMEACIGGADGAVQPVPSTTVASAVELGANQFFDVVGLVMEVKETRDHSGNRSSYTVIIVDGSPRTAKVRK